MAGGEEGCGKAPRTLGAALTSPPPSSTSTSSARPTLLALFCPPLCPCSAIWPLYAFSVACMLVIVVSLIVHLRAIHAAHSGTAESKAFNFLAVWTIGEGGMMEAGGRRVVRVSG